MDEATRGWLAGLYDGEGYITVKANRRARANPSLHPAIVVGMIHEGTGDRVADLLTQEGIRFSRTTQRRAKPEWRPIWRLEVRAVPSVVLLADLLLPFAVTKREQWQLVRDFAASRIERRGFPPTNEELALVEALKILNRRG